MSRSVIASWVLALIFTAVVLTMASRSPEPESAGEVGDPRLLPAIRGGRVIEAVDTNGQPVSITVTEHTLGGDSPSALDRDGRSREARYAQVLDKLESFARNTQRETRSMAASPQTAAMDPALYQTPIELWEETRSEWTDDLIVIEAELPERPDSQSAMFLVHKNLTSAIRELRLVVSHMESDPSPSPDKGEDHILHAREYLRQARRSLEG